MVFEIREESAVSADEPSLMEAYLDEEEEFEGSDWREPGTVSRIVEQRINVLAVAIHPSQMRNTGESDWNFVIRP